MSEKRKEIRRKEFLAKLGIGGSAFTYIMAACMGKENDPIPITRKNNGLDYGSDIFYLGGFHKIIPIIKPEKEGTFTGFPASLKIDENTGEIDLRKSYSGLQYKIIFTDLSGKETSTKLVISGIDYESSIFSLSSKNPDHHICKPFYNGDQRNTNFEGVFFTVPKDGNSNLSDLVIDENTGIIDLKKSVLNGALGFGNEIDKEGNRLPEVGATRNFTIYYQIDDESKKALNSTPFVLSYYKEKKQIPHEQIYKIINRQAAFKSKLKYASLSCMPLILMAIPGNLFNFSAYFIACAVILLGMFSFQMATFKPRETTPDKPPASVATLSVTIPALLFISQSDFFAGGFSVVLSVLALLAAFSFQMAIGRQRETTPDKPPEHMATL